MAACTTVSTQAKKPAGEWGGQSFSKEPAFVRRINSPAGPVTVKLFGEKEAGNFNCRVVEISYSARPGKVQRFAGLDSATPLHGGLLPFYSKDLNFDGINDFRFVRRVTPERTVLYRVWLYDSTNRSFHRSPEFEKIPSPQFDKQRRQVMSSWTTPAGEKIRLVYRVDQQGRLVLLYHSRMEPVRPGVYRLRVTRRVNGKLQQDEPVLRYLQH